MDGGKKEKDNVVGKRKSGKKQQRFDLTALQRVK